MAVPCQCTLNSFQQERIALLRRVSGLQALNHLTFATLEPEGRSPEPGQRARYARAIAMARAFAEDPQAWLVISGASGSGKTHLAVAIAHHCIESDHQALYISTPDLLDHLRAAFAPHSDVGYDELFEHVRSVPLLVLDDLGVHSTTPWAQEKLFQVLNQRFLVRLPTVVVCAVPFESLEDRFRTRLTDQTLVAACVLEGGQSALPSAFGGLDLEHLRQMRFDTFDARGLGLTPEERDNLHRVVRMAKDYAERPEGWLVLRGTNGCGKTHLAVAIAHAFMARGEAAVFAFVPDLFDHLRSAFNPDSRLQYDLLFERVRTAPFLVLDDLDTRAATPWAQEKLYQLLNYRYNAHLPTVITTALPFDALEGRLVSRLLDRRLSVPLEILAPDYRTDRAPTTPAPPQRQRRR